MHLPDDAAMNTPTGARTRENPLGRFLNWKFLGAFFVTGLLASIAGYSHRGTAIIAYPLLAWSPFLLFINFHMALAAGTGREKCSAALAFAITISLVVMAIGWL